MHGKHKPSFILASASPRRRELLAAAGYEFTVIPPDVDESKFSPDGIEPCEFVKILALAKANNVARNYPDKIVVGADTIVDYSGKIIGKPANAEDAKQIVKKLFSKSHKVLTGLAFIRLRDNLELITCETTTVFPKKLTPAQITEHINSGVWKDKAGAYAIQENGDEFIERIDGSMTNVMGLPMETFAKLFAKIPKTSTTNSHE